MRFETLESRSAKKPKKVIIDRVSLTFKPKDGGRMAKSALEFESRDADIPPMKLTPELARELRDLMDDFLEDLKATQWDGDYRIHADWEDPQPETRYVFDDDDW